MNIIISGFYNKYQFPIISEIVKYTVPDNCHIIFEKEKPVIDKNDHIWFYKHAEITVNYEYNCDWNQLEPLDHDLLVSLYECEVVFLKMIERYSDIDMPYHQRKNIYLNTLCYWNHILIHHQIDLFVSMNIPHEGFDHVIYCLCRLKNIKSILFFQSQIKDVIIAMNNWTDFGIDIEKSYQKLLSEYQHSLMDEIPLDEVLKSEFLSYVNAAPVKPFYMDKKLFSLKSDIIIPVVKKFKADWKKLFKGKYLRAFFIHRILNSQKMQERNLFAFYRKNCSTPDFSAKYIYFAMHFQPELTTCPMAGVFVEQILMAQMVSRFLPEDVYIYVKEHPMQRKIGREIQLYKDLLSLPRVKLLPISTNSFDLIANAKAVMTATGTAGWEALIKRKPVLIFGSVYYQYADGVFKIKSQEDCKYAMEQIFKQNKIPDLKKLKIFMKSLEKSMVKGFSDDVYVQVSNYSFQQSNENIVNKIKELVSTN